jgi:hypothetical protein
MHSKLTEIGLKHQTDKAYFHLFTEFYNSYFERFLHRPINILEIGICEGNSILMLKEFFPESTIYAIDINPKSVDLNLGNNVNTYLCSQDNFCNLQKIFNNIKFDIIIEDGSHMTSHQQTSLGFFFPYLNSGGVYVCEDLHTSYRSEYIDTKDTTIDILEKYQATQKIECDLLAENKKKYLNENIMNLQIYERKKNALMCYKCKKNNIDMLEKCVCATDLSPNNRSITSIFTHR